jgi:hypothetical protein
VVYNNVHIIVFHFIIGKDARKRKKRKDVNNKGQALQKGSDMDAFIDEVLNEVSVTAFIGI